MKKRLFLSLFGSLIALIFLSGSSQAYSNNRLIDNAIFDNVNSMSEQDIRNFINSRPSSCLAQSGAIFPEPITYFQYGGNVDAARVIYNSARYSDVNPQVILATLQKEQSLITRTDCYERPSNIDSRNKAMGMGCPDSGPCPAPAYAGFHQQVMKGTWQLGFNRQRAVGNIGWGGNDNIKYYGYMTQGNFKRCASCDTVYYDGYGTVDGQSIFMETGATASLYTYTPHLGQSFPGIFEGWFGTIYASIVSALPVTIVSPPSSTPFKGQTVSYTFSFTNTMSSSLTLESVGAVGRAGSLIGTNRDFGWQGVTTFQPGESKQFTFSTTIADTGIIYAWPAVKYQGVYAQYNNWGTSMNARNANITLSVPLVSSISNPVVGQTTTLSATIKNNESQAVNIVALGIPVRFYDRYNYDAVWVTPSGPIQPNATQVVSGNVTFDKPGPFTAWVSGVIANQYTTLSSILSLNVSKPTPHFSLTYIETPNATPAIGEDVAVKFKLKNHTGVPITLSAVGVVGRYGNPQNGSNDDFGWVGPVSFAEGEEKSFTTFVKNIASTSNFYVWPAYNYQGSYMQYANWGFTLYPHLPNISITSPLTINNGSPPSIGQSVPITVTIKNNEPRHINYWALGIPIRYYGVYNYDAAWRGMSALAPSGQAGESVTLSGNVTFDKPGPYAVWAAIQIQGKYYTIGNTININL